VLRVLASFATSNDYKHLLRLDPTVAPPPDVDGGRGGAGLLCKEKKVARAAMASNETRANKQKAKAKPKPKAYQIHSTAHMKAVTRQKNRQVERHRAKEWRSMRCSLDLKHDGGRPLSTQQAMRIQMKKQRTCRSKRGGVDRRRAGGGEGSVRGGVGSMGGVGSLGSLVDYSAGGKHGRAGASVGNNITPLVGRPEGNVDGRPSLPVGVTRSQPRSYGLDSAANHGRGTLQVQTGVLQHCNTADARFSSHPRADHTPFDATAAQLVSGLIIDPEWATNRLVTRLQA
jgi:hypothetical protein